MMGYGWKPTVSLLTVTTIERYPMLADRVLEMSRQTWAYDEWWIAGPKSLIERLKGSHWEAGPPITRDPRIHFFESDGNVPRMRNECAARSSSDIIIQVDDDDWQHPTRIERQVKALQGTMGHRAVQVVGTNWVYAFWRKTGEIHRISFWNALGFVPGATLAYWREAWANHPFDEAATSGEDGPFVRHFYDQGRFLNQREPTLILYHRHGANASTDALYLEASRTGYRRTPFEILEERRRNPGKALPLQYDDSALDAQRVHENLVNRLFWQSEMGEDEFKRFTGEVW